MLDVDYSKHFIESDIEKNVKEFFKTILPDIIYCQNIFSESFMQKNAMTPSIVTFLREGGLDMEMLRGMNEFAHGAIDSYVHMHTSFNTWKEMCISAATIAFNEQSMIIERYRKGEKCDENVKF